MKLSRQLIQGMICAIVFVLFRFSEFYGDLASAALYVVLAGQGLGIFALLAYAGVTIGFEWSLQGLVTGIVPALGAFVLIRILKHRDKYKFVYAYAIFVFLSFLKLIYVHDIDGIIRYLIELAAFSLLAFCFYEGVRCLVRRTKKLTLEETVSMCVVAVYAMLCLQRYTLFGVPVFRVLMVFIIPAAVLLLGKDRALAFSLLAGVANAVYYHNPHFLGWFAVIALVCGIFSHAGELVYGCAALAGELLLDVFFETELTYYFVVFFAAAAVLFLLLIRPLKKLRARVSDDSKLQKVLLNRSRGELSARLKEVSEVFREMTELFEDMQGNSLSADQAKTLLVKECFERMCLTCPNGKNCLKEETRLYNAIQSAVEKAVAKGKLTLIDVPDFLNGRCQKLNGLMSLVNQLSISYRQYLTMTKNLDSGKQLLQSQFEGVSHIFDNLAGEIRCTVSSDGAEEARFRETLLRAGVPCAEALVLSDEREACAVIEGEADPARLSAAVSKFFGQKYLTEKVDLVAAGTSCAYFRRAPKFDVIFGSARKVKENSLQSGDVHTLVKISERKFLVALCDGMGSGERAQKISSASISLVENLYRAGFSSEFILKTVNKLLITCFEECFTTLDVAVFDLESAKCDFIKVGSADSYIKSREFAKRVSCCSMPLGILEEIRPATSTETLEDGDVVFLVSDGVTDSFPDRDAMLEFISSVDCVNPQECAKLLLDRCLANDGGQAKDDMTVLTMRVFSRY